MLQVMAGMAIWLVWAILVWLTQASPKERTSSTIDMASPSVRAARTLLVPEGAGFTFVVTVLAVVATVMVTVAASSSGPSRPGDFVDHQLGVSWTTSMSFTCFLGASAALAVSIGLMWTSVAPGVLATILSLLAIALSNPLFAAPTMASLRQFKQPTTEIERVKAAMDAWGHRPEPTRKPASRSAVGAACALTALVAGLITVVVCAALMWATGGFTDLPEQANVAGWFGLITTLTVFESAFYVAFLWTVARYPTPILRRGPRALVATPPLAQAVWIGLAMWVSWAILLPMAAPDGQALVWSVSATLPLLLIAAAVAWGWRGRGPATRLWGFAYTMAKRDEEAEERWMAGRAALLRHGWSTARPRLGRRASPSGSRSRPA